MVGDGASRDFERVNERSVDARASGVGIFESKPRSELWCLQPRVQLYPRSPFEPDGAEFGDEESSESL